jgi:hypothetical protein
VWTLIVTRREAFSSCSRPFPFSSAPVHRHHASHSARRAAHSRYVPVPVNLTYTFCPRLFLPSPPPAIPIVQHVGTVRTLLSNDVWPLRQKRSLEGVGFGCPTSHLESMARLSSLLAEELPQRVCTLRSALSTLHCSVSSTGDCHRGRPCQHWTKRRDL